MRFARELDEIDREAEREGEALQRLCSARLSTRPSAARHTVKPPTRREVVLRRVRVEDPTPPIVGPRSRKERPRL